MIPPPSVMLWLWSDHVWVKVTLHTWFGNRQIQQWMSSSWSCGSYTYPCRGEGTWCGHIIQQCQCEVQQKQPAWKAWGSESCLISLNLPWCVFDSFCFYLSLHYLIFTGPHWVLLGLITDTRTCWAAFAASQEVRTGWVKKKGDLETNGHNTSEIHQKGKYVVKHKSAKLLWRTL